MNVNGILSQTAEDISGVPQGFAIGPILFVVYVNDLSDHLSGDSLLFADDFKRIAPPVTDMVFTKLFKRQCQLVQSLGAGLHPHQKRAPSHFVTYALKSHDPRHTQTIPKVSTT